MGEERYLWRQRYLQLGLERRPVVELGKWLRRWLLELYQWQLAALVVKRLGGLATSPHNRPHLAPRPGAKTRLFPLKGGGGENIDFETRSAKSVTWEVAEKMERVWHFSEIDKSSSYSPSIDLLERLSATSTHVSADLLHPQLSVGSEKMSVDLLQPEFLSALSESKSMDLLNTEMEVESRVSTDLMNPSCMSVDQDPNPVLKFTLAGGGECGTTPWSDWKSWD
jgi:hypothetical protein